MVELVLTSVWLVATPPVMQSAPANLTVLDGKDATIACRAIGAPTPNVTWFFNGKCFDKTFHIYFCFTYVLLRLWSSVPESSSV